MSRDSRITRETLKEMVGMSASELREISMRALGIAELLEREQPTKALALAAGIEDRGYQSVRDGYIHSYVGRVEVTMANGSRWLCIGHRNHGGDPYTAYDNGYIEFRPIVGSEAAA